MIKAFMHSFSQNPFKLTVRLLASFSVKMSSDNLDLQFYLVVNLNNMPVRHYFMSLLTHLCYCIKLDIPKPIEHTQVIYTDNI